jgi:peptide/nickel transport system ATP-binding protein
LTGAAVPSDVAAKRSDSAPPLLAVDGLTVSFAGTVAVAGIGYEIAAKRTLGVVGESGCGKTMTALALLGLVPAPGRVSGSAMFEGAELIGRSEAEWDRVRGARIAMIFQEPMTALNDGVTSRVAHERAIELLAEVGISSPRERADTYPHQLSGGMRQRGMIAMALACQPALLIADEPTTALDVTIQAQILELMAELQDRNGMAIQFISHNLAVVSEIADEIIVMYAGRIVERSAAAELFARPLHPYTIGLIETLPSIETHVERLPVIKGAVPHLAQDAMPGCRFADRCPRVVAACRAAEPPLLEVSPGHFAACIRVGAQ